MISFVFTEKQKELYERIFSFARKEFDHDVAADDAAGRFPFEKWRKCGELRLQGLCIPETYGGAGLDAVSTASALEALGYGCGDSGLNFSVGAHLLACVLPIAIHGSEEQKRKYLPALCRGELIACNAMTEPGSGSNAFEMASRAVAVEGGFQLNASKVFLTNAPAADIFVVYATTDPGKGFFGGISVFIADAKADGVTCEPVKKLGLRTSPMGNVSFTNVLIPADRLLAKPGAGGMIFSESMNWERALLGALHVGTMRRLIDQCKNRLREAGRSGHRDNLQGAYFQIADMALQMESARLLVYQAAQALDSRSTDIALRASMAKMFCSEALVEISRLAADIFGEEGCLVGLEIERCQRDALGARIYSGTNEIQKNIIASYLLR